MSHVVRFAPAAELDVRQAYFWYEEQSTGLGAEFLRQVSIQTERLARYPLIHALSYGSVRRAFLGRFPYALHFEIHDNIVLVLGCIHQHRSPRHWPQAS